MAVATAVPGTSTAAQRFKTRSKSPQYFGVNINGVWTTWYLLADNSKPERAMQLERLTTTFLLKLTHFIFNTFLEIHEGEILFSTIKFYPDLYDMNILMSPANCFLWSSDRCSSSFIELFFRKRRLLDSEREKAKATLLSRKQ